MPKIEARDVVDRDLSRRICEHSKAQTVYEMAKLTST
jgi:hypothetical protein